MTDQEGAHSAAEPQVRNTVSAETASGVVVQAGTFAHIVQQQPYRMPVPRQLPPAPARFVGRLPELARLSAALHTAGTPSGAGVVISALAGAGGIGKTALALHWAHAHHDRFPDGQLFVDLQAFSPVGAPLEPAVAVRGFLDAFGVDPDRIPGSLQAQIGLYRSLVEGKRMLIVLDNADGVDQVRSLLPGSPTCTVIVTSRRRLTGLVTVCGSLLDLDVLPAADARRLLANHLGPQRMAAEPEAVAALLACCAGLPLAIRIVAARIEHHPDFPLAVLAEELRDTAVRLDGLDAGDLHSNLRVVLSWSTRALSGPAANLLELLGIAPGPDISLPAVAALAALPVHRTRLVLRELENASLVQQHIPGRYRMHDLIRLFATDPDHWRETGDTREAALRRVIDFQLHVAYAADRLLDPHRPPIRLGPPAPGVHPPPLSDASIAMTWLETEHPTLLAAHHAAAGKGWHAAVWQLAWTLDTFHYRRGHRIDRLRVWEAALDAAGQLPDFIARIDAQQHLGHACTALGSPGEGIEHMQRALDLAEHHRALDRQAQGHRNLAWAWEQRGDSRRALEHAVRARELFRDLDQPVLEAFALNATGWLAAQLGRYGSARRDCLTALAQHRRHRNPIGEAKALDSLGYIAHHTGDYHSAIAYYDQAVSRHLALGNTTEAVNSLDRLGHPHAALGRHELARATWREALQMYQDQGRDADAARVRRLLST
ncbi:tetratricopeptide repeat protein [Amycolatopsis sp. Hca4]|uniref:ATP-binding protein n=1 Tax=Amycolatopsis sp. Hca4 TaxID=2742131 RepID=UPI00159185CD|nr:tetratricopeptide repeat protein [Amycolatopsis sp. Hca4]QKV73800.1 tetratricopeptide repeat protein [Amycolatopsis sp. Hca4]